MVAILDEEKNNNLNIEEPFTDKMIYKSSKK